MPSSTHKHRSRHSSLDLGSKSTKHVKFGKGLKSHEGESSELKRLTSISAKTSKQKIDMALPTHITNMRTGSILPAKSRINVGGDRGLGPIVPLITRAVAPGWDSTVRNLNKLYDQSPQYVVTIPDKTKLDLARNATTGLALQGMAQTFSLADALAANNEALAELILRRNLRDKGGPEGPLLERLHKAKEARAAKDYDIAADKVSAKAKAQNALYLEGDDERKLPAELYETRYGYPRAPPLGPGISYAPSPFNRAIDLGEARLTHVNQPRVAYQEQARIGQQRAARSRSKLEEAQKRQSSSSAAANERAIPGHNREIEYNPSKKSFKRYENLVKQEENALHSSRAARSAAAMARINAERLASNFNPVDIIGESPRSKKARKEAIKQIRNSAAAAAAPKPKRPNYKTFPIKKKGTGMRHRNLTHDIGRPGSKTYDISKAYERARTIMGSLDSGNNSRVAKNQLSDLSQYLYLRKAITKPTYFEILKKYVANV